MVSGNLMFWIVCTATPYLKSTGFEGINQNSYLYNKIKSLLKKLCELTSHTFLFIEIL